MKLICDLNVKKAGHNISYINQIVSQIIDHKIEGVFLLLNREARSLINIECNFVFFLSVLEQESISRAQKSIFLKRRELKIIQNYALRLKCKKIILMELDKYIIPLLFFGSYFFSYSGILFRPYLRAWHSTNKLVFFLKGLLHKMFFRFDFVEKVFILNDEKVVKFYLDKGVRKVRYLVDPVIIENENRIYSQSIFDKYGIKAQKKVILVFGALSDRKNIGFLIETLALLPMEFANEFSLLIVGTSRNNYENRLNELKKILLKHRPEIDFILDYRYVDDEEILPLISQSTLIYLLYKDFYYSSGILGLVAFSNGYCLVPKGTLMEDLVNYYGIGDSIEIDSKEELMVKLQSVAKGDIPKYSNGAISYCKNHEIVEFTNTLLK